MRIPTTEFDQERGDIRVVVTHCQDAYVIRHMDQSDTPAKVTRWVFCEDAYDDAKGEALKLAEQLIEPQPVRYCQVITGMRKHTDDIGPEIEVPVHCHKEATEQRVSHVEGSFYAGGFLSVEAHYCPEHAPPHDADPPRDELKWRETQVA